jgi:molybdenum cofactor biosynthesis enzyme MoaA
MPAEGVPLSPQNDLLTTDEIVEIARLFAKQGVTKVRFSSASSSASHISSRFA